MREGGAGRRLFAVCVAVATMIAVMPTIVARPAGAAVDPVRAHRTFACTLRSRANGRFVTAEIHDRGSSVGVLRAHASSAGVSEQFQCVALSNGWAVKSSANNRYVTAELSSTGSFHDVLRARSARVGSWERFSFVAVRGCTCYGLRAANGDYTVVETGFHGSLNGLLRARASKVAGGAEQFTVAAATPPTPLVPTVAQVGSGGASGCEVLTDGTARCWGDNSSGQLGDGTTDDRSLPVTVLNSAGTGPLKGVREIGTGVTSCALLTDTTVRCWGNNVAGGLGIDTTTGPQTCGTAACSPLPVEVQNPTNTGPLTGVVSISVGALRICAVMAAQTATCWGGTLDGLLDPGQAASLPTEVLKNDGVTPLGDVSQVSVGLNHSCALLTTGNAVCWGSDDSGETGIGSQGASGYAGPLVENFSDNGVLGGIREIAAGDSHTCVLVTNGTVGCFGLNVSGQVGNGGNLNAKFPVLVHDPNGLTLTNVTEIVAEPRGACALLADHTAVCWGANGFWELGDGGVLPNGPDWCSDACSPNAVIVENPKATGPLTNISTLAATDSDHPCAILTDHSVHCWGHNANARLGDNTTIDRCLPVTVGKTTPPGLPPAAPTNVTASPGVRSATIYWSPPPRQPGDCRMPLRYMLTEQPGGQTLSPDNSYLLKGPSGTVGTTFDGLRSGSVYTFTVAATNMTGTGPASPSSNAVTPTGQNLPDAPTNITVIPGDRQVTVSWAPPSDGGSPIILYTVMSSDFQNLGVPATRTSATLTGLTNGRTYTFTVWATNSIGGGPASAASEPVAPDRSFATVPDPPTDVVATAGTGSATVSWTAPVNDGRSVIGTYTITASPGAHTVTAYPPDHTVMFPGLTGGVTYTFSVTATNDIGTSNASEVSNAVTPG